MSVRNKSKTLGEDHRLYQNVDLCFSMLSTNFENYLEKIDWGDTVQLLLILLISAKPAAVWRIFINLMRTY